jgi:hypothetical protein
VPRLERCEESLQIEHNVPQYPQRFRLALNEHIHNYVFKSVDKLGDPAVRQFGLKFSKSRLRVRLNPNRLPKDFLFCFDNLIDKLFIMGNDNHPAALVLNVIVNDTQFLLFCSIEERSRSSKIIGFDVSISFRR